MRYKVISLIIFVVIIAGVLYFSKSDPEKDLIHKYEVERKYHLDQISTLKGRVDDLSRAGETIAKKMQSDSAKFAHTLKANNEAYFKLKREYESINYSRASAAELDSIRAGLITLYSNRGK